MTNAKYFMYGVRPVKFADTPDGGLAALELEFATGMFVANLDRYFQITEAKEDVDSLTEDQFIQRVEAIRSRVVTEDSPVGALYKLMVGIEDVAKEEGRTLRPDEEALLAELRRQSYALFEATYPDPIDSTKRVP